MVSRRGAERDGFTQRRGERWFHAEARRSNARRRGGTEKGRCREVKVQRGEDVERVLIHLVFEIGGYFGMNSREASLD